MNEWFNLKDDIHPINTSILCYVQIESQQNYWLCCRYEDKWTYINLSDLSHNNITEENKWNPIKRLNNLTKEEEKNRFFYWRFINKDFNLSTIKSEIKEETNRFELLDIREIKWKMF